MNRKKQTFWFKFIALLLPVMLLLLLEACLRVAGYGNDLSVFVEDAKYGNYLLLNERVSLRYFLEEGLATRGNRDLFLKKKKKDAVRIFVQGESTAAGFPYFYNGSFPRMLSYRLQHTFPETEWEVVNLSITALNSYSLYDFADEIIAQHPDAVIINAGHNEYYGALGVGSTGATGKSVALGRLGIAFRKTKTGQLLSRVIASFRREADHSNADQTLMEVMAGNQEIPFDSKIYHAGLVQFEKNLQGTLEKYHKAGIRVFLTNTVSNLKNQPPFHSVLSVDNPQPAAWRNTFDAAREQWEQQRDTSAMLASIRQLHDIDTCYAHSWYVLGGIRYAQHDFAAAKEAFLKAKELDALRFRAPEAINSIIRDLSRRYDNVAFVDVAQSFEEHSNGGIIGENLMLEHLHPNLPGHFIIADALFNAMEKEKFKGITTTPPDTATFNKAWAALPLTEADSLKGAYITLSMRTKWPFNEILPPDRPVKSPIETLAKNLTNRNIKWGNTMLDLMQYYRKAGRLEMAVKAGEQIIFEYPYEYALYEETVNLCIDTKQFRKGIFYARKAFALKKTTEMALRLSILYLKSDEPEQALSPLDYLIAMGSGKEFVQMKDVAQKVIVAKRKLAQDRSNPALRDEIYRYYMTMQNTDAAEKYKP